MGIDLDCNSPIVRALKNIRNEFPAPNPIVNALAFWNKADKSHLDGGNYHWRIGNDAFVADWQTAGKNHIHMTVRGRAKPAVK